MRCYMNSAEKLAEAFGHKLDDAYWAMKESWRYGDGLNNAWALLHYYERKRDETPWWLFWVRWHYHDMVAAMEREVNRLAGSYFISSRAR